MYVYNIGKLFDNKLDYLLYDEPVIFHHSLTDFFPESGNWSNGATPISTQGDTPMPRRAPAYTITDSSSMLIHGGYHFDGYIHESHFEFWSTLCSVASYYLDDVYQFHFSDLQWTKLTPICNPTFPCPRARHTHLAVYTPNHGLVSPCQPNQHNYVDHEVIVFSFLMS